MTARTPLCATAVALAALTLGGCSGGPGTNGGRTDALVIGMNTHSIAFPAPEPGQETTHYAGSFLPCLSRAGTATVTAVEVLEGTPDAAARTRVFVRRTPHEVERESDHPEANWAPQLSGDGPVDSVENLRRFPGPYTLLTAGQTFSLRCHDGPRDVTAPRDEILVEVTSTSQGVEVDDVVVRYSFGDEEGEAHVRSRVLICGTLVTADIC